jgi:hypothetical protein
VVSLTHIIATLVATFHILAQMSAYAMQAVPFQVRPSLISLCVVLHTMAATAVWPRTAVRGSPLWLLRGAAHDGLACRNWWGHPARSHVVDRACVRFATRALSIGGPDGSTDTNCLPSHRWSLTGGSEEDVAGRTMFELQLD